MIDPFNPYSLHRVSASTTSHLSSPIAFSSARFTLTASKVMPVNEKSSNAA